MRKEKRYNKSGTIHVVLSFDKNDNLHNNKHPAVTLWYENGLKECEEHHVNGCTHNDCGSAIRYWHGNGLKECVEFVVNDKTHNRIGPAVTDWDRYGRKINEGFFLHGRNLSKEEWERKRK